ncbi:MAG: hypothetical protein HGA85_00425 [Nanoarchaeota archaeon]|nr:hypothetical protein [Nanoarchaeota archaeon]
MAYPPKVFPEIDMLQSLVDCNACPPERNCCYFDGNYTIYLNRSMLENELCSVETRLADGKLGLVDENTVKVIGPCPFVKGGLCDMYQSRVELGLEGCVEFPFTSGRDYDRRKGKVTDIFFADYRCHSVESAWERIEPVLTQLKRKIPVYIKFNSLPDAGFEVADLDFFCTLKRKDAIPEQSLPAKKYRKI